MTDSDSDIDDNVETWTFRGYEMVVGLEVHVELATRTKLFSASPNRFGDEPNTNIDPVTLGLPGALPVLNEQAVELAMRIGLASSSYRDAVEGVLHGLGMARYFETIVSGSEVARVKRTPH